MLPPAAAGRARRGARPAARALATHPRPKTRRFRRAKTTYPKVAKAPKPVKPMKPPKPKRRRPQGARPSRRRVPVGAARPAPSGRAPGSSGTGSVILAAPLLVVVGGVAAYAKLTEGGPSVAVPDVADREVFAAIAIMHDAGFALEATAESTARVPAASSWSSDPATGAQNRRGLDRRASGLEDRREVPDVSMMDVEAAKVELRRIGLWRTSPSSPTTATTSSRAP